MDSVFITVTLVIIVVFLPLHTFEAKLTLTGTVGKCGEPTRLICTGVDIQARDRYIWYKGNPRVTITSSEHNNQTVGRKYQGSAGNGKITLDINHTNNNDVGQYTCSHNYEESNVFEVTQTCSNSGGPTTFSFLILIVVVISGKVIQKYLL